MARWLVCRQCRGDLGELYTGWRRLLVEARARIEAHLDFGEEGHEEIPDVSGQVGRRVRAVVEAMTRHLRDGRRGELVRGGVRLAILGRPNAGKSTCLNALLRRPAAIVSPIPGTTRDVVSGTVDLAGFPVQVLDTAGLRRTEDALERQGVTRALDTARDAHAALLVLNARDVLDSTVYEGARTRLESHLETADTRLITPTGQIGNANLKLKIESSKCLEGDRRSTSYVFNIDEFVSRHLNYHDDISELHFHEMDWYIQGNYVILINKIDLLTSNELSILQKISFLRGTSLDTQSETIEKRNSMTSNSLPSLTNQSQKEDANVSNSLRTAATTVPVSLTRGDSLDIALQALEEMCARLCASDGHQEEVPMMTSARHRIHVTAALRALLAVTGETMESHDTREESSLCSDQNDGSVLKNFEGDRFSAPINSSRDCFSREDERRIEFISNGKANLLESEDTLVAAAHYLHQATRHLGHVTGDVTTEHVLDQIFKEFCIGK